MVTPNSSDTGDLVGRLSTLIVPVADAGGALASLATGLEKALAIAPAVAPVIGAEAQQGLGDKSATASSEGVTTEQATADEVTSRLPTFFDGFFAELDRQYKDLFSNLFGNESSAGIFGSLGGIFSDDAGVSNGVDAANTGNIAGEISKEDEKLAEDRKKKNAQAIKEDGQVWGGKLANAISGSKKLLKVHRALSLAGTIMDTAKGISAAFAGPPSGPPWPLNIAQAALVAATGAAQIATIKGQAHDGLDRVPSTGTYLLERGERVVDRRLNRDLSSFLSGRPTLQTVNNDRGVTNSSPTINLTINGDAAEDAVQSNRGALESMIRDIYADHALQSPFD